MLDQKLLRTELDEVSRQLGRRGFYIDKDRFTVLEQRRRELQAFTEELQSRRNKSSKRYDRGKDAVTVEMKQVLKAKLAELDGVQSDIFNWMLEIPNIPHKSVPDGKTEQDNKTIRKWGNIPDFGFVPLDHAALGERMGEIDFERAAKITGSRFVTVYGKLAKLHRALIQFMLDTHIIEHGYEEVYVPYIVNAQSLIGTGQLPKFGAELFKLQKDDANTNKDYYLIPTAEVPVTNLWRDRIAKEKHLPIKYVCHTPCFRSEAGSYGKDTRGMVRQHQFEKVELVQLVKPGASWRALEELTQHAEAVLKKLELPYRVVSLCTGDLGFASAKTYDIEVWLPGQGTYREISSCSNFLDFQARRLKARWKNPATGKNEFLHTLNGSGLAVGRTLVAIMENYQDKQGRVRVPKVLRSYMNDREAI